MPCPKQVATKESEVRVVWWACASPVWVSAVQTESIPFSVVFDKTGARLCCWVGRGWRLGVWGCGYRNLNRCADSWDSWAASVGTSPGTITPMLKWAEVEHSHQEMNSHVLLPRACPSQTPRPLPPCSCRAHLVRGSGAYHLYTWKMGSTVWPRSHPRHPCSWHSQISAVILWGYSVGWGLRVCTSSWEVQWVHCR